MKKSYYNKKLYNTRFYKQFIESDYNIKGGKSELARNLGISQQSLTNHFKRGFNKGFLKPLAFSFILGCNMKDVIENK